MLNRTMFLAGDTVPADAAVVGVVLGPEQRPTEGLAAGDAVRAYLVAADGSTTVTGQPAGTVLLDAARVVASGTTGAGSVAGQVGTDSGTVSLLVPTADAAGVVAAAAAGQVALVRLADATTPSVDLVRE
ncbi:hypothetical protein [Kineococcus aurantiacus]|uniref:SAF domain-containing protein n=1 Tax=Kineococcus aurantiacus TaxID=37633 RepID=A0A7Y9DJI7_9ACTN|nr:hypothetical protein [Kineococcus aurantiacus]NYD20938.1 hypothetical protein [Kineococcus aurantiacus]